jgi:hypothetical protein
MAVILANKETEESSFQIFETSTFKVIYRHGESQEELAFF